MKKLILIVFVILMIFVLSSCSGMEKVQKLEDVAPKSFVVFEAYGSGDIVIDTETKVMYWLSTGAYNGGTLTLLVDSEGKPKIWEKVK